MSHSSYPVLGMSQRCALTMPIVGIVKQQSLKNMAFHGTDRDQSGNRDYAEGLGEVKGGKRKKSIRAKQTATIGGWMYDGGKRTHGNI
ncbi:hypothetical protein OUZ56_007798 [Daphnia magna]|uniref:Uncharacterized protein n=1 Tax=Daphnia magna TaxID=35525 RepID=A0ABR0AB29_9CRUS|nr:hypothetical protein OUZ56_007798 [Daphnia magna]